MPGGIFKSSVFNFALFAALSGSVTFASAKNCDPLSTVATGKKVAVKIPEPEISAWEKDAAELLRIRALPAGEEKKAAIRKYAKPDPQTWLGKGSVLANWGLAATSMYFASKGLYMNPDRLLMAASLQPIAWYAADMATQIGHKWLDSIASPMGKIWGEVVRSFRKHHEFANNLNEEDYLSNVAPFGPPMLIPFAANAAASPFAPPEITAAVNTWLLGFLNATEIHKQAHMGRNASPFFKAGQKAGVFVTNEVHMAHHKPPFDANYSVISGWFNPMAKRLNLWDAWDRHHWRTKRRLAHTWIEDPTGIPDDIVKELKAEPGLIPNELWANGEVYPYRVPPTLRETLETAKQKWRAEFIVRRRLAFQEAAVTDQSGKTEADYEKAWEEDQKKYSYLYGNELIPLFEKQ
jgi:hypothetical protein